MRVASFEFGVDRVKEFCCVHQAVFRLESVQSSESTRQKVLVEVPLEVPVEVPPFLEVPRGIVQVPPERKTEGPPSTLKIHHAETPHFAAPSYIVSITHQNQETATSSL